MTKEHYETELVSLKEKLRETKEQIVIIKEQYIEANKTFQIGDRVKTAHNEFGIVYGFGLDWNGDVKPLMKKEKKDGKASKFELNVYKVDQVRLADNF